MILYHGTTEEGAKIIPARGFSLETERTSDPGDFGWGIYLTGSKARAKAHGIVLAVKVDLKNPVKFNNIGEAYLWREKMIPQYGDTIHGVGDTQEERQESRVKAAKKWRNALLAQGHDGLIINDPQFEDNPYEVVVFEPQKIEVMLSHQSHILQ